MIATSNHSKDFDILSEIELFKDSSFLGMPRALFVNSLFLSLLLFILMFGFAFGLLLSAVFLHSLYLLHKNDPKALFIILKNTDFQTYISPVSYTKYMEYSIVQRS